MPTLPISPPPRKPQESNSYEANLFTVLITSKECIHKHGPKPTEVPRIGPTSRSLSLGSILGCLWEYINYFDWITLIYKQFLCRSADLAVVKLSLEGFEGQTNFFSVRVGLSIEKLPARKKNFKNLQLYQCNSSTFKIIYTMEFDWPNLEKFGPTAGD